MGITTGILLFEDMEELDFAGPYEVFGMSRKLRGDEDRVVTVAEASDPLRAYNGLRVLPDHTFADAPELDVLVVPGGLGTRREAENPVLMGWLRETGPRCTWLTSVCTGTLVLHIAGLTQGRRVTTHWAFVPTLREQAGVEAVLEGVRYVRDGNLVTAAGVSAGIDMSLWLVGQLHGPEHARQVQRMMQYDPAPPYQADV